MHFHLPKPLHGWREFAGEVGIIVIGVLIALGAEQVVENLHQRAELHDAEQAMRSELRDDDLPQAYTRAALYRCYSGQLDAIENAVASGDRANVTALAADYRPLFRTWDEQAWQAALNSNILVYSGSKRMIDWATAFTAVPLLQQTAIQEQAALPQLWAKLSGQGSLSAEQQDRLFQVLSTLRLYNREMGGGSVAQMQLALQAGVSLTPQQKSALLANAAKAFGPCVAEPSSAAFNIHDPTTRSVAVLKH